MDNNQTISVPHELARRLVAGNPNSSWDALGDDRLAAAEELRGLLAKSAAQQPKEPVAESLAQMITEWVDTGIKMGADWRPRLASVIALRLARFPAVQYQGEPVAWRGLNSNGEVVTDWVDGAPPKGFVDLCGNPTSYAKIQLAWSDQPAPMVLGGGQ